MRSEDLAVTPNAAQSVLTEIGLFITKLDLTATPTLTPAPMSTPVTARPLANASAASFASTPLASESIISAFGSDLSTTTQGTATAPLPTTLAGTTVKVKDSAGSKRPASLFFVSPAQLNYQMPLSLVAAAATITSTSANGIISAGQVEIA